MLEYEYRRSMQKNELLLWSDEVAKKTEYYELMFLHNRMPGVLQFVQEESGEGFRYCYDIRRSSQLQNGMSRKK